MYSNAMMFVHSSHPKFSFQGRHRSIWSMLHRKKFGPKCNPRFSRSAKSVGEGIRFAGWCLLVDWRVAIPFVKHRDAGPSNYPKCVP